ncbi:MAG TPA: PucR family transcriptional regulator [Baekduia sp.]|nr:PucR family transcriptional regulator [Baekduia sp.]
MLARSAFTLGELLDREELGLELVAGGADARERLITGAHCIEGDHPAAWLEQGWIMLTTGMFLPPSAEDARTLVVELGDRGVTALGLGVGPSHAEAPVQLIDAADDLGFPVFTVADRTAFRDVTQTVFRCVLDRERLQQRRAMAAQHFLLDALSGPEPQAAMLARLATVLTATVAVIRSGGAIEDSTGDVEIAPLRDALERPGSTVVGCDGSRQHMIAAALDDERGRWLVVAVPPGSGTRSLTRMVVEAAVPLFAAAARLIAIENGRTASRRRELHRALMLVSAPHEAQALAVQATEFGLDISAGVTAVVVRSLGGPCARDRLHEVEEAVRAGGLAALASVDGEELRVLAQAPITDEQVMQLLLGPDAGSRAGVGRAVTRPLAIKQSTAEAALAVAARGAGRRRVVRYDELELSAVLMHEMPLERLGPKIEQIAQPLREQPVVLETLRAYMERDLDVAKTARHLRVHPNSVRYRLAKVEDMIGGRLRSPENLMAVLVALACMDERPRDPGVAMDHVAGGRPIEAARATGGATAAGDY